MKRSLTALALLTFCSLSLISCKEKNVVSASAIPAERMDCVELGKEARPAIPPEYVIDWSRVTTVPEARAEFQHFVGSVRIRERTVAGYVLRLEGQVFACANDAAWLREVQTKTVAK